MLISQVVPQLGASNNVEVAKQVFVHTRLSRAYLALARLTCTCIQSPFVQTRTKPEPDPKPGFSKKASVLESLVMTDILPLLLTVAVGHTA